MYESTTKKKSQTTVISLIHRLYNSMAVILVLCYTSRPRKDAAHCTGCTATKREYKRSIKIS